MKVCTKCRGGPKPSTEFHKDSSKPDGLRPDCKACVNEATSQWKASHPEKVKIGAAKYRAENSDKVKAGIAKWQKANPEKTRASAAKWRSANPDKAKAAVAKWFSKNPNARRVVEHNRRARKRATGGRLSAGLARRLYTLQRGRCPCCREPLGDNYQLDHRMPLALGGVNEDWNMQLLRTTCNQKKGAKHPIEFMQQRGFLL